MSLFPSLGGYALDAWRTAVTERQRFERGRLNRTIIIKGAADGFAGASQVEAALDALAGATLTPEPVLLRLRAGRALPVRLRAFERMRHDAVAAGAFTLELEALAPWEEAETPDTRHFTLTAAGAVDSLCGAGTLATPLWLSFTASGLVMLPRFALGDRELGYDGMLADGDLLVADGATGRAYVNGDEVTGHIQGDFLLLYSHPETLSFDAEPDGARSGSLALAWKDRWL